MQLISVNIGQERTIQMFKSAGKTSIYKLPVCGPVRVTTAGLAGDSITDTRNHGGADQAVYMYGSTDYDWWSRTLGYTLGPGTFGENLTITDLECTCLAIGDRLKIGGVLLEVTAPRIPCNTLAARMGDPGFVKRFRVAERPGAYFRVLGEGMVKTGDMVTWELYEGDRVPVSEIFREYYNPEISEATLRRHLAAPLAIRARKAKEEQLIKILTEAA